MVLCGKLYALTVIRDVNLNYLKNYFLEKLLNARLFLMKKNPELTEFIGRIKSVKKILVVVPRDRAQEVVARKYLTRIKDAFPGSRISTLDIFNLRQNDVNWLGVPNDQFVDRFRKEKFDLLIDLNSYHDTLCSYLAAQTDAEMRMHICEGRYDKIYNLHVRTDSNTSLERRYSLLVNNLTRLAESIRQAPAA